MESGGEQYWVSQRGLGSQHSEGRRGGAWKELEMWSLNKGTRGMERSHRERKSAGRHWGLKEKRSNLRESRSTGMGGSG